MDPRWIVSLPAAPPSVAEWEDLLVRMEIMTRALRVTLEEAGGEAAGIAAALRELVDREAYLGHWLQAAAVAAPQPVAVPEPEGADRDREDPRWLVDRFASLRARNFAMLQRRGLDVWSWTAVLATGERATTYQVITALVQLDTETLAALRGGARLGAAC